MAEAIMAHFVAGYPDMARSLAIALGLARGGAAALEMQFPYSDPMADGPDIQAACHEALEAGFGVSRGFDLARELAGAIPGIPLFIMSYAGLVFARGIDAFCAEAKASGAAGIIAPDLSPGSDEGLYDAGRRYGIDVVPVIVPSVRSVRLEEILAGRPTWVYAALRSGITGSETYMDGGTIAFLESLRGRGAKVMAGFGIRTPEQAQALSGYCDLAVVGSEFVRSVDAAMAEGADPGERAMRAMGRFSCIPPAGIPIYNTSESGTSR